MVDFKKDFNNNSNISLLISLSWQVGAGKFHFNLEMPCFPIFFICSYQNTARLLFTNSSHDLHGRLFFLYSSTSIFDLDDNTHPSFENIFLDPVDQSSCLILLNKMKIYQKNKNLNLKNKRFMKCKI